MIDAVLRVFGEEFDVGAFLQKNPLSVQVEPFLKGEPDILGNPNSESGFDAILSEKQNTLENLKEIQDFLLNNKPIFNALKHQEAFCIIDIASGISAEQEASQSILLMPEFLRLCSSLNVSIELSTYPEG